MRLDQGLPQRWIYIERDVLHPLNSDKIEGVKANIKYQNKPLAYIFHQDILNVKNTSIAKIRVIVGPNGVVETGQQKFQVKNYLQEIELQISMSFFLILSRWLKLLRNF